MQDNMMRIYMNDFVIVRWMHYTKYRYDCRLLESYEYEINNVDRISSFEFINKNNPSKLLEINKDIKYGLVLDTSVFHSNILISERVVTDLFRSKRHNDMVGLYEELYKIFGKYVEHHPNTLMWDKTPYEINEAFREKHLRGNIEVLVYAPKYIDNGDTKLFTKEDVLKLIDRGL